MSGSTAPTPERELTGVRTAAKVGFVFQFFHLIPDADGRGRNYSSPRPAGLRNAAPRPAGASSSGSPARGRRVRAYTARALGCRAARTRGFDPEKIATNRRSCSQTSRPAHRTAAAGGPRLLACCARAAALRRARGRLVTHDRAGGGRRKAPTGYRADGSCDRGRGFRAAPCARSEPVLHSTGAHESAMDGAAIHGPVRPDTPASGTARTGGPTHCESASASARCRGRGRAHPARMSNIRRTVPPGR